MQELAKASWPHFAENLRDQPLLLSSGVQFWHFFIFVSDFSLSNWVEFLLTL